MAPTRASQVATRRNRAGCNLPAPDQQVAALGLFGLVGARRETVSVIDGSPAAGKFGGRGHACYPARATLPTMTTDETLLRMHAAADRLAATRPAIANGAPWTLAERFDDTPEAEWGPPEVLAHVAEMIPFWQGEMERIIAGAAAGAEEPVPFGRVATDGVRLGILERDRSLPPIELYDRIATSTERFERRWSTITAAEHARLGLHPRLGEMSVKAIADRFIVTHLADHAVQMESILDRVSMEP